MTLLCELGTEVFFNARHFVSRGGKSGPIHPHSWRVGVVIRIESDPHHSPAIGYAEIKELIYKGVHPFRNTLLNAIPPFDQIQPTTENIARVLFCNLETELTVLGAEPKSVTVWESPTNFAMVTNE